MKGPRLKLDFFTDLNEHIEECKAGPYVGEDGTDVLDMARNYGAHLDHWTFSAIAYLIRHRVDGKGRDLLKAAHFIKKLYEKEG